jgi:hypothetical protein
MKEIDRALADITLIRSRIARGTAFRGYGPATLAATGVLAASGAAAQAWWLPEPRAALSAYIALWVGIAALSVIVVSIETLTRAWRVHSALAPEMIATAVERFLPAAVTGVLLTIVVQRFAVQSGWMLPGLWQIVFGLGVFASRHALPGPVFIAGIWYLGAGLACLALAQGEAALSPWTMGVGFGAGQLLIAALLQVDGEVGDGEA